MGKIVIDDTDFIVASIIQRLDENNDEIIGVVGYYGTIVEILNMLIKTTDLEIEGAEIWPHEYDDYDDAYGLSIYDGYINVEKMYNEKIDRYYINDIDYSYVEEDFADDYSEVNNIDVIFAYKDEEEHKDDHEDVDSHLCVDADRKGFCFCFSDNGFEKRFVYKGEKELKDKEVFDLVSEYFSD